MGTLHHLAIAIDPDRFRLPEQSEVLTRTRSRKLSPPSKQKPAAYVQTELEWFTRAARAMARSPAALAVGTLLYRAAIMQRTRTPTTPTKALQQCGVSLHARRNALAALAKAGLVTLQPRPHRSPQVTVLCAWLDDHLRD